MEKERREVFTITIKVDKKKLSSDLIERMVEVAGRTDSWARADFSDMETITWIQKFDISYQNIVSQLQLILDLFDISSVFSVETEELGFSKCLIQESFCRLEQLEHKFVKPSRKVSEKQP